MYIHEAKENNSVKKSYESRYFLTLANTDTFIIFTCYVSIFKLTIKKQ